MAAKLKGMTSVPVTRVGHKGPPLTGEEIQPTPGKTEVWVDGRLVGEIKDAALGTEAMTIQEMSQEDIDRMKEVNEAISKRSASRAPQSKKEVARMAK